MNQTKLESLIEQIMNIGSGFFLAWATWEWVVLSFIAWGWLTIQDTFLITCIFTVVSFIRSYYWRRFFNAELHKVAHQLAKRIRFQFNLSR